MSSNSLKNELANHIYHYLRHEAKYSDLPEAAKESLTAASECIEQAYKLNTNNSSIIISHNNHNKNHSFDLPTTAGNNTSGPGGGGGGSGAGPGGSGGTSGASGNTSVVSNSGVGKNSDIHADDLYQIFTRHKESKPSSRQQQSSGAKQDGEPGGESSGCNSSNDKHSRKHKKRRNHLIPGSHHRHHSIGFSVHQKNLKQKLIALIKKFRTDGSDFDNEEQYREALERELMKAAAGRGSRAIEELLEEDIDVEEESNSEPEDWDNISETSTPKPSLRPFFSSTTLDKI